VIHRPHSFANFSVTWKASLPMSEKAVLDLAIANSAMAKQANNYPNGLRSSNQRKDERGK
jgi:hypothetical protein